MENPWKRYSKINPQRENGHREISNEVYLALMKADLTGGEYKIALAVIEKTWGFNKPSDKISCSQFSEMTGLSGRMVNVVIKSLKQKRIIHYEPSKTMGMNCGSPLNEFCFNKHYDTWKTIRVKRSSGMKQNVVKGEIECNLRVKRSSPTKETITKETSTKENTSAAKQDVFFDFKTGEFTGLNGKVEIWAKAYPAIDVYAEIKKAAAWLIANPKNKKSDYPRFLNNWLNRAQDRAPKVNENGGTFRSTYA